MTEGGREGGREHRRERGRHEKEWEGEERCVSKSEIMSECV